MRPLYCDESIWIPVADGLRRRGWAVLTARDEERLGDPDREHLSYAVENDWILVTFDDDFLSLVESPASSTPESSTFNRPGVTLETS
jgi:predicted nuclease of predicted toxin-antitoxin system